VSSARKKTAHSGCASRPRRRGRGLRRCCADGKHKWFHATIRRPLRTRPITDSPRSYRFIFSDDGMVSFFLWPPARENGFCRRAIFRNCMVAIASDEGVGLRDCFNTGFTRDADLSATFRKSFLAALTHVTGDFAGKPGRVSSKCWRFGADFPVDRGARRVGSRAGKWEKAFTVKPEDGEAARDSPVASESAPRSTGAGGD